MKSANRQCDSTVKSDSVVSPWSDGEERELYDLSHSSATDHPEYKSDTHVHGSRTSSAPYHGPVNIIRRVESEELMAILGDDPEHQCLSGDCPDEMQVVNPETPSLNLAGRFTKFSKDGVPPQSSLRIHLNGSITPLCGRLGGPQPTNTSQRYDPEPGMSPKSLPLHCMKIETVAVDKERPQPKSSHAINEISITQTAVPPCTAEMSAVASLEGRISIQPAKTPHYIQGQAPGKPLQQQGARKAELKFPKRPPACIKSRKLPNINRKFKVTHESGLDVAKNTQLPNALPMPSMLSPPINSSRKYSTLSKKLVVTPSGLSEWRCAVKLGMAGVTGVANMTFNMSNRLKIANPLLPRSTITPTAPRERSYQSLLKRQRLPQIYIGASVKDTTVCRPLRELRTNVPRRSVPPLDLGSMSVSDEDTLTGQSLSYSQLPTVISRVGRADPIAWVADSTRTKSEETVLPWSVVTSARDTDISTLAMMSRRSDSDILDSEPDYQSNNNAILPEKESTTSLASGCHNVDSEKAVNADHSPEYSLPDESCYTSGTTGTKVVANLDSEIEKLKECLAEEKKKLKAVLIKKINENPKLSVTKPDTEGSSRASRSKQQLPEYCQDYNEDSDVPKSEQNPRYECDGITARKTSTYTVVAGKRIWRESLRESEQSNRMPQQDSKLQTVNNDDCVTVHPSQKDSGAGKEGSVQRSSVQAKKADLLTSTVSNEARLPESLVNEPEMCHGKSATIILQPLPKYSAEDLEERLSDAQTDQIKQDLAFDEHVTASRLVLSPLNEVESESCLNRHSQSELPEPHQHSDPQSRNPSDIESPQPAKKSDYNAKPTYDDSGAEQISLGQIQDNQPNELVNMQSSFKISQSVVTLGNKKDFDNSSDLQIMKSNSNRVNNNPGCSDADTDKVTQDPAFRIQVNEINNEEVSSNMAHSGATIAAKKVDSTFKKSTSNSQNSMALADQKVAKVSKTESENSQCNETMTTEVDFNPSRNSPIHNPKSNREPASPQVSKYPSNSIKTTNGAAETDRITQGTVQGDQMDDGRRSSTKMSKSSLTLANGSQAVIKELPIESQSNCQENEKEYLDQLANMFRDTESQSITRSVVETEDPGTQSAGEEVLAHVQTEVDKRIDDEPEPYKESAGIIEGGRHIPLLASNQTLNQDMMSRKSETDGVDPYDFEQNIYNRKGSASKLVHSEKDKTNSECKLISSQDVSNHSQSALIKTGNEQNPDTAVTSMDDGLKLKMQELKGTEIKSSPKRSLTSGELLGVKLSVKSATKDPKSENIPERDCDDSQLAQPIDHVENKRASAKQSIASNNGDNKLDGSELQESYKQMSVSAFYIPKPNEVTAVDGDLPADDNLHPDEPSTNDIKITLSPTQSNGGNPDESVEQQERSTFDMTDTGKKSVLPSLSQPRPIKSSVYWSTSSKHAYPEIDNRDSRIPTIDSSNLEYGSIPSALSVSEGAIDRKGGSNQSLKSKSRAHGTKLSNESIKSNRGEHGTNRSNRSPRSNIREHGKGGSNQSLRSNSREHGTKVSNQSIKNINRAHGTKVSDESIKSNRGEHGTNRSNRSPRSNSRGLGTRGSNQSFKSDNRVNRDKSPGTKDRNNQYRRKEKGHSYSSHTHQQDNTGHKPLPLGQHSATKVDGLPRKSSDKETLNSNRSEQTQETSGNKISEEDFKDVTYLRQPREKRMTECDSYGTASMALWTDAERLSINKKLRASVLQQMQSYPHVYRRKRDP